MNGAMRGREPLPFINTHFTSGQALVGSCKPCEKHGNSLTQDTPVEKGQRPLLKLDYTSPSVPAATIKVEQGRAYETPQRNAQSS